eukprot:tig00001073_g6814.t1
MKIAVLQSSYEGSNSCFKEADNYDCNPGNLYGPSEHTFTSVMVRKRTAVADVLAAAREGYDMYINLCDGAFDEDRAGVEVIHALEAFGLPYTGADAAFYSLSKDKMKCIAQQAGVRTAPFVFARDGEGVEAAGRLLRFPVIVKHPNSGGSIGMTRRSKCGGVEELREQAGLFLRDFGGVLVEEFIAGREFTVLVAEDAAGPEGVHVYPPVECAFPPGEEFKHFDMKWTEYGAMVWGRVEEAGLAGRLQEAAGRAFAALAASSYARLDFRSDDHGEIFFLEINANPGIFYPAMDGSADIILALAAGHRPFVDRIMERALARHRRARPAYEVRLSAEGGRPGLFARRDLAPNETIARNEAAPLPLACAHGPLPRPHSASPPPAPPPAPPPRLSSSTRAAATGCAARPAPSRAALPWAPSEGARRQVRGGEGGAGANAAFRGLDLVATRDIPRGHEILVPARELCVAGPACAWPDRLAAAACASAGGASDVDVGTAATACS